MCFLCSKEEAVRSQEANIHGLEQHACQTCQAYLHFVQGNGIYVLLGHVHLANLAIQQVPRHILLLHHVMVRGGLT